jgi:YidC/Oxa1 family membrane protein insertase
MGLVLYWVTTNLWTVGQGLVTRRLAPKPGELPTAPRRSSRTPPKEPQDGAAAKQASEEAPEREPARQSQAQPRRVKKKKRARR